MSARGDLDELDSDAGLPPSLPTFRENLTDLVMDAFQSEEEIYIAEANNALSPGVVVSDKQFKQGYSNMVTRRTPELVDLMLTRGYANSNDVPFSRRGKQLDVQTPDQQAKNETLNWLPGKLLSAAKKDGPGLIFEASRMNPDYGSYVAPVAMEVTLMLYSLHGENNDSLLNIQGNHVAWHYSNVRNWLHSIVDPNPSRLAKVNQKTMTRKTVFKSIARNGSAINLEELREGQTLEDLLSLRTAVALDYFEEFKRGNIIEVYAPSELNQDLRNIETSTGVTFQPYSVYQAYERLTTGTIGVNWIPDPRDLDSIDDNWFHTLNLVKHVTRQAPEYANNILVGSPEAAYKLGSISEDLMYLWADSILGKVNVEFDESFANENLRISGIRRRRPAEELFELSSEEAINYLTLFNYNPQNLKVTGLGRNFVDTTVSMLENPLAQSTLRVIANNPPEDWRQYLTFQSQLYSVRRSLEHATLAISETQPLQHDYFKTRMAEESECSPLDMRTSHFNRARAGTTLNINPEDFSDIKTDDLERSLQFYIRSLDFLSSPNLQKIAAPHVAKLVAHNPESAIYWTFAGNGLSNGQRKEYFQRHGLGEHVFNVLTNSVTTQTVQNVYKNGSPKDTRSMVSDNNNGSNKNPLLAVTMAGDIPSSTATVEFISDLSELNSASSLDELLSADAIRVAAHTIENESSNEAQHRDYALRVVKHLTPITNRFPNFASSALPTLARLVSNDTSDPIINRWSSIGQLYVASNNSNSANDYLSLNNYHSDMVLNGLTETERQTATLGEDWYKPSQPTVKVSDKSIQIKGDQSKREYLERVLDNVGASLGIKSKLSQNNVIVQNGTQTTLLNYVAQAFTNEDVPLFAAAYEGAMAQINHPTFDSEQKKKFAKGIARATGKYVGVDGNGNPRDTNDLLRWVNIGLALSKSDRDDYFSDISGFSHNVYQGLANSTRDSYRTLDATIAQTPVGGVKVADLNRTISNVNAIGTMGPRADYIAEIATHVGGPLDPDKLSYAANLLRGTDMEGPAVHILKDALGGTDPVGYSERLVGLARFMKRGTDAGNDSKTIETAVNRWHTQGLADAWTPTEWDDFSGNALAAEATAYVPIIEEPTPEPVKKFREGPHRPDFTDYVFARFQDLESTINRPLANHQKHIASQAFSSFDNSDVRQYALQKLTDNLKRAGKRSSKDLNQMMLGMISPLYQMLTDYLDEDFSWTETQQRVDTFFELGFTGNKTALKGKLDSQIVGHLRSRWSDKDYFTGFGKREGRKFVPDETSLAYIVMRHLQPPADWGTPIVQEASGMERPITVPEGSTYNHQTFLWTSELGQVFDEDGKLKEDIFFGGNVVEGKDQYLTHPGFRWENGTGFATVAFPETVPKTATFDSDHKLYIAGATVHEENGTVKTSLTHDGQDYQPALRHRWATRLNFNLETVVLPANIPTESTYHFNNKVYTVNEGVRKGQVFTETGTHLQSLKHKGTFQANEGYAKKSNSLETIILPHSITGGGMIFTDSHLGTGGLGYSRLIYSHDGERVFSDSGKELEGIKYDGGPKPKPRFYFTGQNLETSKLPDNVPDESFLNIDQKLVSPDQHVWNLTGEPLEGIVDKGNGDYNVLDTHLIVDQSTLQTIAIPVNLQKLGDKQRVTSYDSEDEVFRAENSGRVYEADGTIHQTVFWRGAKYEAAVGHALTGVGLETTKRPEGFPQSGSYIPHVEHWADTWTGEVVKRDGTARPDLIYNSKGQEFNPALGYTIIDEETLETKLREGVNFDDSGNLVPAAGYISARDVNDAAKMISLPDGVPEGSRWIPEYKAFALGTGKDSKVWKSDGTLAENIIAKGDKIKAIKGHHLDSGDKTNLYSLENLSIGDKINNATPLWLSNYVESWKASDRSFRVGTGVAIGTMAVLAMYAWDSKFNDNDLSNTYNHSINEPAIAWVDNTYTSLANQASGGMDSIKQRYNSGTKEPRVAQLSTEEDTTSYGMREFVAGSLSPDGQSPIDLNSDASSGLEPQADASNSGLPESAMPYNPSGVDAGSLGPDLSSGLEPQVDAGSSIDTYVAPEPIGPIRPEGVPGTAKYLTEDHLWRNGSDLYTEDGDKRSDLFVNERGSYATRPGFDFVGDSLETNKTTGRVAYEALVNATTDKERLAVFSQHYCADDKYTANFTVEGKLVGRDAVKGAIKTALKNTLDQDLRAHVLDAEGREYQTVLQNSANAMLLANQDTFTNPGFPTYLIPGLKVAVPLYCSKE